MAEATERSSASSWFTATSPALCVRLFGPLEIRLFDRPLPRLRSRKEPLLIALLALHPGRELERRWLAGALWSDSPEGAALTSLRTSLKDIRRALGGAADLIQAPRPRALCLPREHVAAF
jgi:DNA-binding SARP family transcriptional activator